MRLPTRHPGLGWFARAVYEEGMPREDAGDILIGMTADECRDASAAHAGRPLLAADEVSSGSVDASVGAFSGFGSDEADGDDAASDGWRRAQPAMSPTEPPDHAGIYVHALFTEPGLFTT
eukprot:TRINITY_DN3823_c0_g1_i2.p2 TRINITY_DN3823_c0_g1~~TRINITY_DN3823_c0_g1_i2.p2  ORF type:complete len:120 (+),score=9.06 TRINITY_DN3823_c0_g1_i2:581-940(+)